MIVEEDAAAHNSPIGGPNWVRAMCQWLDILLIGIKVRVMGGPWMPRVSDE